MRGPLADWALWNRRNGIFASSAKPLMVLKDWFSPTACVVRVLELDQLVLSVMARSALTRADQPLALSWPWRD